MNKTKILFLILVLLISISYVKAIGVGNPIPNPLNAAPGQDATFFFSIDSPSIDSICDISFGAEPIFDISFYTLEKIYDKGQQIPVKKGTTAVYSTVSIPSNTQTGEYKQTFCVSCKPTQESGASAILGSTCGIPLNINVIANPKGQIAFPQRPKTEGISTVALLGAIVVVFLVGLAIYSGLKKKPSKQKK